MIFLWREKVRRKRIFLQRFCPKGSRFLLFSCFLGLMMRFLRLLKKQLHCCRGDDRFEMRDKPETRKGKIKNRIWISWNSL